MKIGYTVEAGTREYHAEMGQLIIIVDVEEVYLQEYLVQKLIEASEDEGEIAPLKEVLQYVQVSHTSLSS